VALLVVDWNQIDPFGWMYIQPLSCKFVLEQMF